MPRAAKSPVTAYAENVIGGKIVAGRLVRLACERHLRDLKDGGKRGIYFDHESAKRAIDFFGFLHLAEGQFEGRPFALEPFQAFIVGSLTGWMGPDKFRRFRTAYVEIGKGNGKSPLAAGLGLYGLLADGEASAEIYSAATTREQAGILFRDAKQMAEASPALRRQLDIGLYNIAHIRSGSFFRPLSSEHRGLDGKRPHMGLIDEVHEHRDSLVVDKIRAGTKGRRQAMIFEITNSGYDKNTVCYHHHSYSAKILEGLVDDDSWFAYVCQLDPCESCRAAGKDQPTDGCETCDDWRDEKVWIKANPCLGVSITLKYLREQVREAVGMPTKEGIVRRLNFCRWTESATHAIPMDKWDACARKDAIELSGRECFAALDIGATSDFTAFARLFPEDDAETIEITGKEGQQQIIRRSYTVRFNFWLPEQPVKRDERMQNQIDLWRHQGFIRTTPGEVVDYDQVLLEVEQLCRETPVIKFGIDRGFQGAWFANRLVGFFCDERKPVEYRIVQEFPQGIISMNAPFREFIELIRLGRIHHDGQPVMRWMCSNCSAETRGGLIKPSKDLSTEKIDGVTAVVMALGLAMRQVVSVYADRGLTIL